MAGGSKSKNKGNAGERELCKYLSEAFGGSFIRSSNSGSFIGGKNAARKAGLSRTQVLGQKGDIIPPDEMPFLVIESKFYKEFSYHLLLSGSNALLDEWIGQVYDAKDDEDFWIIAFKANRRPWCIVFDASLADRFILKSHSIYVDSRDRKFVVCQLHDFVDMNKEAFRSLAQSGL